MNLKDKPYRQLPNLSFYNHHQNVLNRNVTKVITSKIIFKPFISSFGELQTLPGPKSGHKGFGPKRRFYGFGGLEVQIDWLIKFNRVQNQHEMGCCKMSKMEFLDPYEAEKFNK